jgi:hypothetical protein
MWILTTLGFYSVVRKPEDEKEGMLTVRGRVRGDLEGLKRKYLPDSSPISEDELADYRYRFRVKAANLGEALSRMAGDIDYRSFKRAVAERQGLMRHDIYLLVWQVLRQLYACDQELEERTESDRLRV